jgi:hypothetical protein
MAVLAYQQEPPIVGQREHRHAARMDHHLTRASLVAGVDDRVAQERQQLALDQRLGPDQALLVDHESSMAVRCSRAPNRYHSPIEHRGARQHNVATG